MKEFSISVVIQELDYTRTDGVEVWVNRATLEVGPHRTVVKSKTLTVRTHHAHNYMDDCEMNIQLQSTC